MNDKPNSSTTIEVVESAFEQEVLKASMPVLVLFEAAWSRPCQIMRTVVEDISVEWDGVVKTVRMDADDCPDLSVWYEIQSVPTLMFFRAGFVCGRLVGTSSKDAILNRMKLAFFSEREEFSPPGTHRDL